MMKKLLRNISMFFHSLFFGMKGGDKELLYTSAQSLNPDSHSEQEVETGTVYQDMLRENVTQQVKETRDATYRVFREADNYLVQGDFSDSLKEFNPTVVKKGHEFFEKPNCKVAVRGDDDDIYLIQDQNEFSLDTHDKLSEVIDSTSIDPDRIIKCNYEDFIPSFDASRYVKKVVVFNIAPYLKRVELYFPAYASQFNKTDSIFFKKLKDCINGTLNRFDSMEMDSVEFITSKAFGKPDLFLFKFGNLRLDEMFEYDGNIVVSYTGMEEISGMDLTAKYRTEEMDRKYETMEQKSDTIDFNAVN